MRLFRKRSFGKCTINICAGLCKAYVTILFFCIVLTGLSASAQKADTTKQEKINLQSNIVYAITTDTGNQTRFIGNAIFQQGTDTLYCDSLYRYNPKIENQNAIYEAFGDVRIAQAGGTQGTSNYLRYTANKKLAFMTGNVVLTDGNNNLHCEELTYDLGTKTGVYDKGGILHSDSTTVSSNSGVYNVKSKDARFKGNVHIVDPQYKIKSEDIGYNTETKFESFFSHSIVTSDSGKSILETSNGTYDSKKGIAHFLSHSSIWDDGQYIEGDSLNYDKSTGFGLGLGHVISIDTAHHATLYCGRLEYYQRKRVLWATIKPVMQQVNGKDTFYMRADTFYSAPMVKAKQANTKQKELKNTADSSISAQVTDSLSFHTYKAGVDTTIRKPDSLSTGIQKKATKKSDTIKTIARATYKIPVKEDTLNAINSRKGRHKKIRDNNDVAVSDTTSADTTAPLYFIGYHHVKIFSDSLQGKCDSVCYTRSDSTIRMMYAPIVWAHNSQITGDTILLHLDSSELHSIYVPSNAFVISQSGPPKAQLFDQVQGKTLTAYFKNQAITNALVFPNAESIYFSTDDKGAYLGMDQSKSERMHIYFEDQKIADIKFDHQVELTMTPMEKVDFPNAKLSRFKWLVSQKPKNKQELFK